MMPVKVEIGEILKRHAVGAVAEVGPAVLGYGPRTNSQGEWVNAVMATAPFLTAQGLQQALHILNCAMRNVQGAKTLEQTMARLSDGYGKGAVPAPAAQVLAAALMHKQLCEQQRALLSELHALRRPALVNRGGALQGASSPHGERQYGAEGTGHRAKRGDAAVVKQVPGAVLQPSSDGTHHKAMGSVGQASVEVGTQMQVGRGLPRQPQGLPSLSSSLQVLAREDPDCLFIVRRINKLGFKACRQLKQHFSAYGQVVRVLVAHSTVRHYGDPQCQTRRRPSSLGFVHMATAAAVRLVLALGEDQEVNSAVIRVQRFERQAETEAEALLDELSEGRDGELWKDDFGRQLSSASTATTGGQAFEEGSWSRGRQESSASTVASRPGGSTPASSEELGE